MKKKKRNTIVPAEGQIYRSVLEISVIGVSREIRIGVTHYPEEYMDNASEAVYIQMPESFDLMQKVLNFIKMEMGNNRSFTHTHTSHIMN